MFSYNSFRRDHSKLADKQRPNVVAIVTIAAETSLMAAAAAAAA